MVGQRTVPCPIQSVTGNKGYSCGGDPQTSDSFNRKSLLSWLVSAEETLSISYLKESLKSYFQQTVDAAHTTAAAKLAAQNSIKEIDKATSFAALSGVLDFGTQVLFGETYASAGFKTAAHFLISVGVVAVVGLTALTGGAALAVGIIATIALDTVFDVVYDEYFKEAVDKAVPYSLYD